MFHLLPSIDGVRAPLLLPEDDCLDSEDGILSLASDPLELALVLHTVDYRCHSSIAFEEAPSD